MSAPASAPARVTIELTFNGLLVYHLWREFPDFSSDDVETLAQLMIGHDGAFGCTERHARAWNAALRDRVRFGVDA